MKVRAQDSFHPELISIHLPTSKNKLNPREIIHVEQQQDRKQKNKKKLIADKRDQYRLDGTITNSPPKEKTQDIYIAMIPECSPYRIHSLNAPFIALWPNFTCVHTFYP